MPFEDLMTAAEVAEAARVDVSSVLRWARSVRLPTINLGGTPKRGSYRFRRSDVEALLTPTTPAEAAQ